MAEATDWAESGDAGDQIATAQTTVGAGSLSHITGAISIFPDHVDIYCVNVPDPQGFYAIIDCTVNADPDLWLFDQDGYGIAHEDVCSGGVVALTPQFLNGPGPYFIAITASGDEAISSGGSIWAAPDANERAPDGPGAAFPLQSWTNISPLPASGYTISFLGAETCDNVVSDTSLEWGTLKSLYR